MDTVIDRHVLDAFADGALSPEESARVVMHLADCPADSAYVDAVMEANEMLAAAYAAPLYQPLPERFRAAIFPGGEPAPGRAPTRTGWRPRRPALGVILGGALAASLGLVIGFAVVPMMRSGAGLANGPGAAEAILRTALESSPSGPVADGTEAIDITLVGTFFDREGRPCREYESLDRPTGVLTQGVACHGGSAGWTMEAAVANRIAAPEARGESYVPAEGAVSAALDDALDRLGAGMTLSANEEQTLIAGDWKR